MTRRLQIPHLAALVSISLLMSLAGCGGGGTASYSPPNNAQPPATDPGDPTIVTSKLVVGYQGRLYEQTLNATGGSPPYEWTATDLPSGLGVAVGTDWFISGYPSELGVFYPTLQVRDSRRRAASATLELVINEPLSVLPEGLPNGVVNRPYSHTFHATGGDAPYTWYWRTIPDGALPPGLSLSPSGVLGGTPIQGGFYWFIIEVRDSAEQLATREFTLFIESLRVTTSSLPAAYQGDSYAQALEAQGGDPPMTWALASGSALPPGLSLSASGLISGTPTETGTFPFTVEVRDAGGQFAAADLTLFVVPPVTILTTTLPQGNIGTNYYAVLQAAGGIGVAGYRWALEPGSDLPEGMTLNEFGGLFGIPLEAGTFELVVSASDWGSTTHKATQPLTLSVDNRLAILPDPAPPGIVTRPYGFSPRALGGTPPYAWSIVEGNAAGIFAIDASTGQISATPSLDQAGDYSLRVQVTDASASVQSASHVFFVHIIPAPSFGDVDLPAASPDVDYWGSVGVSGGWAPRTLTLVSGSLPPGLNLSDPWHYSFFSISGRPTTPGDYRFSLELADSTTPPLTARQEFQIHVNEKLQIITTSLPAGNFAEPYLATVTAVGGAPPYTWSGYLTQELHLDPATGEIFGFPTTWGDNVPADITVRDSAAFPQSARRSYSMSFTNLLKIRTTALPPARVGAAYRVTIRASGGSEPYQWSIVSGALPIGLALNASTGEISGTATADQVQTLTVRVRDSGNPAQTDDQLLTLSATANPGRNDSIATATPLSNGVFPASLSPYADPVTGPGNPDQDYYRLTALPGSVVVIEVFAGRLLPPSPADTVIELLDDLGARLSTCRRPGDSFSAFDQACLNDDVFPGSELDSKLEFRVTGTLGTPVIFFLRVLDWRGMARPDFRYELYVHGAE